MIGTECAWVNFQYAQSKIYGRNKELLDNTKELIYSCKANWSQSPSFWTKKSNGLESKNLFNELSDDFKEEKTFVNTVM